MNIKLTVFFDDPFWVGVFERMHEGLLETSRVVFGAEPKDYEVYAFVQRNYAQLVFSKPVAVEVKPVTKINPKRLQREIRRETSAFGVGTKARQAMKLGHESRKTERRKLSREYKEELEELKFQKRQEKKKKGH